MTKNYFLRQVLETFWVKNHLWLGVKKIFLSNLAIFCFLGPLTSSLVAGIFEDIGDTVSIDRVFYYSTWMPSLKDYYSQNSLMAAATAIRASVSHSAILDLDDTLYAATVYEFGSNGICIAIFKIRYEGGSLSSTRKRVFYPYTKTYTGFDINCTTEPDTSKYKTHKDLFNKMVHNAFAPTLVKDVTQSNTLGLFLYCAPIHWMHNDTACEGILYFTFNKNSSNLSLNSFTFCKSVDDPYLRFDRLPPCRQKDEYQFVHNAGNLFAWKNDNKVSLCFISVKSDKCYINGNYSSDTMHYIFEGCTVKSHGFFVSDRWLPDLQYGTRMFPRYIKSGDYVYSLDLTGGFVFHLYRQNMETERSAYWHMMWASYIEKYKKESFAPYNSDFCIVKSANGQETCGFLSFIGGRDGWGNYVPWDLNTNVLALMSFYLKDRILAYNPQNVLYQTGAGREGGSTGVVDIDNNTASDKYRIYLNTHKICTYKSPKTGMDYLFYCYCYPGEDYKCCLGYAPYYVDENNRLILLTKTEYKALSRKVSRIISMDCQNGLLWLTWVNSTQDVYYCSVLPLDKLLEE